MAAALAPHPPPSIRPDQPPPFPITQPPPTPNPQLLALFNKLVRKMVAALHAEVSRAEAVGLPAAQAAKEAGARLAPLQGPNLGTELQVRSPSPFSFLSDARVPAFPFLDAGAAALRF